MKRSNIDLYYQHTLEERIAHGGHPVLRWMMDNIFVKTDPAGNIKPDKEKSIERIDGAIVLIMALDRVLRHGGENAGSVYDETIAYCNTILLSRCLSL